MKLLQYCDRTKLHVLKLYKSPEIVHNKLSRLDLRAKKDRNGFPFRCYERADVHARFNASSNSSSLSAMDCNCVGS